MRIKIEGDARPAAGLSALAFSPRESSSGRYVFYSVTDRGPNAALREGSRRPFLEPSFQPQILKLEWREGQRTAKVLSRIGLSRPDGRPVTGLPNAEKDDEIPIDMHGRLQQYDPWGLDPEELVLDGTGGFWLAEEYGPSLVRVNPVGGISRRLLPRAAPKERAGERAFPAVFASRGMNRGFEALAWSGRGTLLAFLESPPPGHELLIPVLELDPRDLVVKGVYLYPADPQGGKLGAAATLPDGTVLVLEQNGKTGASAFQRLYAVGLAEGKPLFKTQWMDLTAAGLGDIAKLEGLACLPDGRVVIVNDNDFAVDEPGDSFLFIIEGRKP